MWKYTLTEGLASGSEFPLGETTVTYTATDAAGNNVTTTFTVTVVDNIAPEISCTNDISETVGENGTTAVVTYDAPVASDNCEFTVEQTAGLASGSEFPLGTTTNTFVVTDAAGNTATCSFDVMITDDEDPTITCPAPINVNVDAETCGAVVEFSTPEGFDNSGDVTVTQIAGPASGETFPVGTTTVTFQVEDASGNTATCSFDVTVNDNEAPEITSVSNITQNVDVDSCSATVEYELPTATDNCEGVEVTLTEGLASGSEFPLGVTEVTYTATDAAGNEVTTTFTVTVVDNIAPEISCANDISDTVGENGTTAVVTYDAPVASDNCEFTVEQTAGLASGSEFPLGTTTNTFVVTDAAGNTATCSFDVTINRQPQTPDVPVVAAILQPNCDAATGSFNITAVAGLEYSFNGGEFGNATSWTELAPGTYTVVARNAAGLLSEELVVTINAQPNSPATPVIEELLQPTCEDPTGFLVLELVDSVTFILTDADGTEFADDNADGIFEELAPGTYTVTSTNENGCVSEGVTVTIEEPQGSVTVNNPSSPVCDDSGAFDLNSLISDSTVTGTWMDTDQTGALTGSTLDPDMAAGFYTFTYVVEGACASTTAITVEIEDCGIVLPCEIQDVKNSISKAVTPNGDNIMTNLK